MSVIDLLSEHGWLLLGGATGFLTIGALGVACVSSPIRRQRLGELTLISLGVWVGFALIPMARIDVFPGSASPSVVGPSPSSVETATGAATPGSTERWEAEEPASVPAALDVSESGHIGIPLSLGPDPVELTSSRPRFPVPVASPAASEIPPPTWGVAVYLLGGAACLAYLLLSALALVRLLMGTRPAPGPVQRRLARAPGGAGVRLLISDRTRRPFCLGILRPSVVLPSSLCDPSQEEHLDSVLLHELAHLRQRDARGLLLFAVALPFLYFHPLYWWLRREVRRAAELVADDQAATAIERAEYARRLLDLAAGQTTRFMAPLGAHSFFRSPSELTWRIEMLMQRSQRLATGLSRSKRWVQRGVAAALVTVMVLCVGVEPVPAQGQRRVEELMAERAMLKDRVADLEAQIKRLTERLESINASQGTLGRLVKDDPLTRDLTHTTGALSRLEMRRQVEEGDSMASISRQLKIDPERIIMLNPELRDAPLKPGQWIRIPVPYAGNAPPRRKPTLPAELPAPPAPILDAATLSLVTRSIDLAGELELAERRVAYTSRLVETASAPEHEMHEAQIQLQTIRRKMDLTRRLLAAEIRTSEAELESLEVMRATDPRRSGIEIRVIRARERIRALKSAM